MAPAQFLTHCVKNWECSILPAHIVQVAVVKAFANRFAIGQHLPSGKPVAEIAGSPFLQTGVVARCSSYFKNFTNFVAKHLFIAQSKRTNFFAIFETICNKSITNILNA